MIMIDCCGTVHCSVYVMVPNLKSCTCDSQVGLSSTVAEDVEACEQHVTRVWQQPDQERPGRLVHEPHQGGRGGDRQHARQNPALTHRQDLSM